MATLQRKLEEKETLLDQDDNEPPEKIVVTPAYHLSAEMQKVCEPERVSLGPLCFGRPHLHDYQKIKDWLPSHTHPYRVRQLNKLAVRLINQFSSRIRNWYPKWAFNLGDKNLGWLMARDGLFLLHVLRELTPRPDFKRSHSFMEIQPFTALEDVLKLENSAIPLFRQLVQAFVVQKDIMRLENRIPIFILESIIQWEAQTYQEMMQMMLERKAGEDEDQIRQDMFFQARTGTYADLNSILRQVWSSLSPFPDMHEREESLELVGEDSHILEFVYENIAKSTDSTEPTQCNGRGREKKSVNLPTAEVLNEIGVKFSPHKGMLNDIRFDGRTFTFYLPTIEMDGRTDAVMRNLLAFEALCRNGDRKPLWCYVDFMNKLINKGKDVEVLRDSGVIQSRLGTDEEVANVWNEMGKALDQKGEYKPIATAIDHFERFHRSKHRVWYAGFKKKNFSKPLIVVILSSIAGSFIILLTIIQTILAWEQVRLQKQSMSPRP